MSVMPRPIIALAALSLAAAGCADRDLTAGPPAAAPHTTSGLIQRLAGSSLAGAHRAPAVATAVVTDPARFVQTTGDLFADRHAAAARLSGAGFVAGATRTYASAHRSARSMVLRFADPASARAGAARLLLDARRTRLSDDLCDISTPMGRVAGVPGARGVLVNHRTTSGVPTKAATIVFTDGPFVVDVSAEAEGAAPVARLQRAARRAYRVS